MYSQIKGIWPDYKAAYIVKQWSWSYVELRCFQVDELS